MDILGVKIDNLGRSEILNRISGFLSENKFHQIATVNPEFILTAEKNPEFKKILNNCDLNIADGIGIWFAFLRFGKYLKSRIAGADLMLEILKLANDRGLNIFLACRRDGLSSFEEIRDAIHKIYPKLNIGGANLSCHSERSEESQRSFANAQDDKNDSKIVFVNFGAPHQEIFINSVKNDNIKLAMGVGGSFDFLTGKIKRAPKFLRCIGLEWLWRLLQEPKRFRRIFSAVIVFPILSLTRRK